MSQVKKIPMRKCVGCQEMKSKREMIRIPKGSSWMRQERKTAEVHIFADPGNALKKRSEITGSSVH